MPSSKTGYAGPDERRQTSGADDPKVSLSRTASTSHASASLQPPLELSSGIAWRTHTHTGSPSGTDDAFGSPTSTLSQPGSCFSYQDSSPDPGKGPMSTSDDGDSNSHDLVLRSQEGRRYRFSLNILAKYSHFADGLLSLPQGDVSAMGPEPEAPVIDLPIRAQALSYILECIMGMYHSRGVDPLVAVYAEEVFTFVDMLDCPEMFEDLLAATSDDDIPSKFTLAILREDYTQVSALSLRLMSFSDEYYTHGWWMTVLDSKAPDVVRQLATLFDSWNNSYLYFREKMTPKFPRTVFSHQVYWLASGSPCPCDQQLKHRGNFSAFHTEAIRPLWNSFSNRPLMSTEEPDPTEIRLLVPQFNNVADNIAMLGIECLICQSSLLDEVRSVLSTWQDADWGAKRKLGLSVAPSPADMDAWRVHAKLDSPSSEAPRRYKYVRYEASPC